MKKATILFLLILIISGLWLCEQLNAGWSHFNEKTFWTDAPTPATCWRRDNTSKTVEPLMRIEVFNDTIYYLQLATSNALVNSGYWVLDATMTIYPDPDITAADCSTNLYVDYRGAWIDVEWDIDGEGTLIPKL